MHSNTNTSSTFNINNNYQGDTDKSNILNKNEYGNYSNLINNNYHINNSSVVGYKSLNSLSSSPEIKRFHNNSNNASNFNIYLNKQL